MHTPVSPPKRPRIGPRMREAADYVDRHPGCPMLHAARYVAPTGVPGGKPGLKFGYESVWRAVAAGLIRLGRGKGNAYALFPSQRTGGAV